MLPFDRLSALIDRFELAVSPADIGTANLIILRRPDDPGSWCLLLNPSGRPRHVPFRGEDVAFSADVAWGGGDNPLLTALPIAIERQVAPPDELDLIVRLLVAEREAMRCGSASVLNRLGEVLIVRMMREAIAEGSATPGVLGSLSDPRLSRAIVAIHEKLGHAWRIEDLAEIAGLSRSRFAEVFSKAVGETPLSYLRRWRLALARQDIKRVNRIQTVARRYGYASGEALNHAIRKRFGVSPTALRKGEKQAA